MKPIKITLTLEVKPIADSPQKKKRPAKPKQTPNESNTITIITNK